MPDLLSDRKDLLLSVHKKTNEAVRIYNVFTLCVQLYLHFCTYRGFVHDFFVMHNSGSNKVRDIRVKMCLVCAFRLLWGRWASPSPSSSNTRGRVQRASAPASS